MCLSAYLSLCVEAAARDGLEEIYITKHPQVHREISNIEIQARTIKEWFQDVRGGERKEGEGSLPGCTQQKLDLKKKRLAFQGEKGWQC